jgi:4-amino-4-deoxy-L-arabinose transferase-like glycosyltransferase
MIFRNISIPACSVFFLGFVLRLVAWGNTSVINPDGALYIHQARAIYYGQTDTLFCALNYLTNLPIMIAGSYWVFHDWVFSARFVSFFFGFGTLIPLYATLKRFFDDRISVLGLLVFAVMPVFVSSSVDIIRDPISWFFVAAGLYYFIAGLEGRSSSFPIFSCLCFMMAAWARVEASLVIVFSLIYLVATRQENKTKKILSFMLPVIGLILFTLVFGLLSKNPLSIDVGIKTTLLDKLASPLVPYYNIQNSLSEVALHNSNGTFGFFLGEVKKNVWLVALGSVLNRCLEAFFYPFFLVCVVGIGSSLRILNSDQRVRYFIYLSFSILIALYCHMFRSWYIDYRHVGILILSCVVFIGFGIDYLITFLKSCTHIKTAGIYVLMAIIISLLPLYKNMIARDPDKRIYKDIGEFISTLEPNNGVIPIATSCSIFRVVSFYANMHHTGAPCPEGTDRNCWEFFTNNYDEFLQHLKREKIKYFLWAKRLWPADRMDLFIAPYNSHFRELRRWSHPDTGEMILFEVT